MAFRVACLCLLLIGAATAFSPPRLSPRFAKRGVATLAKLDYNDPIIAEEFMKIQMVDIDDVEEELGMAGVPSPKGMNEMDLRLLLVEVRLRAEGRLPGTAPKETKKKTKFGNDFERALYEKPMFKKMYEQSRDDMDTAALNVMTEYLNNPKRAKVERSGAYWRKNLLRRSSIP